MRPITNVILCNWNYEGTCLTFFRLPHNIIIFAPGINLLKCQLHHRLFLYYNQYAPQYYHLRTWYWSSQVPTSSCIPLRSTIFNMQPPSNKKHKDSSQWEKLLLEDTINYPERTNVSCNLHQRGQLVMEHVSCVVDSSEKQPGWEDNWLKWTRPVQKGSHYPFASFGMLDRKKSKRLLQGPLQRCSDEFDNEISFLDRARSQVSWRNKPQPHTVAHEEASPVAIKTRPKRTSFRRYELFLVPPLIVIALPA